MMLSLDDVLPLHLADFTAPDFHALAGQRGQVFGFAVRHPHGIALVDTGIGWGRVRLDAAYRTVRIPLAAALGDHGIRLNDVVVVINTHLHMDHCGGNRAFPGVPIYVQAVEYRAAHAPRYTIPEWLDFPGSRYEQIGGEVEILPGVSVVPTPGHTPGHQSVVVQTSEGLAVIAGQAIYSAAEYEHIRNTGAKPPEDPPPDPTAYLASARRLISLEARRVFFSHDGAAWGDTRGGLG